MDWIPNSLCRWVLAGLVIGATWGCESGSSSSDSEAAAPTPAADEASSATGLAAGAGTGEAVDQSSPGTGLAAVEVPPEPPPAVGLADASLDLGLMVLDEALGRYVVPLADGRRVVLTLDPDLQDHLNTVVRRYDEPAEAVVAIEPSSGRVLAWIEDHNDVSPTEHPASSAGPWAASVFKVVTAATLIEEVNLGLARRMCVPPGRGEFDDQVLVSNPDTDTRCVDLIEAMAESVNVYFGRLSVDHLAPEVVDAWLLRFGFNQPIPFEVPVDLSEAAVPAAHLERARMAAGLRHAHMSPLHAALIAASVANGGVMMRPTLVDRILDSDGNAVYEQQPAELRRVMSAQTARTLTRAMSQTTVTGTAARYFGDREGWPDDLAVAGKTGTLSNRSEQDPEPDPLLIYSWFAGFAPIDAPTIAVAGVVYNGERWHIKGSYLASEAIIRFLRH